MSRLVWFTRVPRLARLLVLAAVVLVALFTATTGSAQADTAQPSQQPAPTLGVKWAQGQTGYGRAHPRRVFNGGDPTGIVAHIHWTSWGKRRAVGRGSAVYEWPGTSVADNGDTKGAKIVAFHLGRCDGHSSYNAVSWFFPKYGQRFDPKSYINDCKGIYHSRHIRSTTCRNVHFRRGGGTATQVSVAKVSCAFARRLVAGIDAHQYLKPRIGGHRFLRDGYRCGTDGKQSGIGALFECRKGNYHDVLFWDN